MINIKAAIERKFPRYTYVVNSSNPKRFDVITHGTHKAVLLKVTKESAGLIVSDRNELVHALIKASELLAEAVPQPVETTPVVHKRWRV